MKMTKPIKDGILNRKNILLLALGISTAGNLFLAKTLRQTTQERDRYLQALEWENKVAQREKEGWRSTGVYFMGKER